MNTLFVIFILSLLFAYLTERTTIGEYVVSRRQTTQNRFFYALLLLTLILPVGLRRIYNDTGAYINGFQEAPTITELFSSGELHILQNPAFEVYTSLVRTFTDNYSVYFLIAASFVMISYAETIRRYVKPFHVGIGLLFCLGTYVFSIAAMKQTIAMAILLLALPKLLQKKYGQYILIVFIAFLFHTYAIAFLILPLFTQKPWNWRTIALLMAVFFVMWNFENVIGSFLDYANESGKSIAEYEVFDNAQVNIFRVLVYAVVPVMSLLFRKYLFDNPSNKQYCLFINMAIISCSIMMLGLMSGANMFARMAIYFEFGLICSLPWMIKKIFTAKSARFILVIASICFLVYFMYANIIAAPFDYHYRAVSLWDFIISLF
ncbi:MAG: EpsG family protein [Clostridia bacterium]|nr:EpsG family protein [Clostridia bacterium]